MKNDFNSCIIFMNLIYGFKYVVDSYFVEFSRLKLGLGLGLDVEFEL